MTLVQTLLFWNDFYNEKKQHQRQSLDDGKRY